MNKGKIVKVEERQILIKMEDETKSCKGCSLSSACRDKTLLLKHSNPSSFREGQEIFLDFDWTKFTKYMLLLFFLPALIFVAVNSVFKTLCATFICGLTLAVLSLILYFAAIHKKFKEVQFFRIVGGGLS